LGKSLTHVIDASIGIESSEESAEDEGQYNERTHSDTGASEVSVISLRERQAMQRAKQLAFLKEQGLIKEESNLRGGAGASPGAVIASTR
jgi:cyanophycinase-like exopeptidase